MNAESTQLSLHTYFRWLSKGEVLKRVYELHGKLALCFIEREKTKFKDSFSQEEKLNPNAYLAGIFGLFDQMNISLQGHSLSITDLNGKIKYFQMKVDLWLSVKAERKGDIHVPSFWLLSLKPQQ
jgi:hypothetical protein